jgi:CO dehydrogenase/acetyl-CoA synthase alpha subunit
MDQHLQYLQASLTSPSKGKNNFALENYLLNLTKREYLTLLDSELVTTISRMKQEDGKTYL